MKQFIIITLCLFVSACGDKISGEYGGKGCIYSKMIFKGDGVVYVTAFGSEYPASYKIDGDKLILEGGKSAAVFKIEGDMLDGGRIIGKCVKQ